MTVFLNHDLRKMREVEEIHFIWCKICSPSYKVPEIF